MAALLAQLPQEVDTANPKTENTLCLTTMGVPLVPHLQETIIVEQSLWEFLSFHIAMVAPLVQLPQEMDTVV